LSVKIIIGPSVQAIMGQKAVGMQVANLSTTSILALGKPTYKILLCSLIGGKDLKVHLL